MDLRRNAMTAAAPKTNRPATLAESGAATTGPPLPAAKTWAEETRASVAASRLRAFMVG